MAEDNHMSDATFAPGGAGVSPASKRILFVRSGGGLPGLDIHTGIWCALEEAGVRPTEVCGTSAGAIVSAIQAAGRPASFAAALIASLRDSDVRREVPFWQVRIPWINHFLENGPILEILKRVLPPTFDGMQLPFSAWATRFESGESVNVATPEISPSPAMAAMASASICGVFPAVKMLDNYSYIDGGVRRNLPLPTNWRDYDQVWLLIASGRPRDYIHARGILTHLIRNVDYLMQDQISDVLDLVHGDHRVHVVWPKLHITGGKLHFDHAAFQQAYNYTRDRLYMNGGSLT
jgi:predicted acylesterase/phospholipase RssA